LHYLFYWDFKIKYCPQLQGDHYLEVAMKRVSTGFLGFGLLLLAVFGMILPVHSQAQGVQITAYDKAARPITSLTDGNQISLKIDLAAAVPAAAQVEFILPGINAPVADCSIPAGERTCQSQKFSTLGWYWDTAGISQPQRVVIVSVNGQSTGGSLSLNVDPRPVVMVHGFNSTWEAWTNYLGPQGFLASIGVRGYAVGDGQVAGVLNTGSLSDPTARTNTIAQNAVILGEYIDNVKRATGAEKVDLVVHSMGGMIARYYIDRVMIEPDVAQLIILGTPMAGSACADLPAALGILLPATLEIQPGYMTSIFNRQIVHRHGVPFYALAGTKLVDAVQSPCTPVPSDMVVTLDSVKAIPMPVQEISLLHIDLNTAPEVFESFVKSLLQTPPGKFESPPDPTSELQAFESQQFTKVYTGHLEPGATQDVTINIDPNVAVANFALYDTSRSLTVSVKGASGKVIELDPLKNGVIQVDDPSTLVYLGYGFKQPKAGKWIVTLQTSEQTPPQGADFAIMAKFTGGATLTAKTNLILPKLKQSITASADLNDAGQPVALSSAQAILRKPDGSAETLPMQINGNTARLFVRPDQSGIYGLELSVTAQTADAHVVDRAAFLTFEVQPAPESTAQTRIPVSLAALLLVLMVSLIVLGIRRRRANKI
jgi:pimeloyl-ACP methyl ester carboxylesterase